MDVQAYIVLDDNDVPVAGIPFSRIEDIRGKRIVSLSFSDACDPLVKSDAEWQALIEKLLEEQAPVIVRCLHNDIPLKDDRFKPAKVAKWHGLDLAEDLDTLWSNIHSSARRAVRKAEKAGMVARRATTKAELQRFFEIHQYTRKYKYRLLAQPYKFFENIWDIILENGGGQLMIACYGDQIIGSVIYFEWQDTLTYKFSAVDQDYLNDRATDLLIWEGIRYAKDKGFKKFDFGLSDWDQDGLISFKRKYATEEKTISFLECDFDIPTPPIEKKVGGVLRQLTDLFTEPTTPDDVTEKAGDLLYRYFA
jgi:CelD/BcsL family acetyltransferase involved in cellulose biosynthesis